MPRLELQYPKEPFSTVKRHDDRASYALRTIHEIVNEAPLVHVAFQDPASPFPAVLPMIGQMGSFDRPSADISEVLDLYIHSYVTTRMMRIAGAASPPATSLPVTVSAALVDGLILALSPFSHSYNYRSVVLFGHATPVTDPDEKLYALELITDAGAAPGRWANTRGPPTPAELQSTGVLRVRIATGSAKIHTGLPNDSAADREAQQLPGATPIWAGVLPTYTTLGKPIPAPHNTAGDALPGYLAEYWTTTNTAAREQAFVAAGVEPPKDE